MIKQRVSKNIQRLWRQLSKRRQDQFVALLGLMLISTFAEVVSLGAVVPFLAVLTEPEQVFSYPFIASRAQAWGITSADQLVLPLSMGFGFAAIVAGVVRVVLLWMTTRIAYASASDLSIEAFHRALYQPYSVHLSRNSSKVISMVTQKVNDVAFGVLMSLPVLLSSSLLLGAILCVLIAINPLVSIVAGIGFGGCYCLITWISRHRLREGGDRVRQGQTQIIKLLQESFGSIRDVILDGTQSVFSEAYRKIDVPIRRAQGTNLLISASPRAVMEALGMVLIAALAYQLSRQSGGISTSLPMLGALALGAQRMLPALQQIYGSWTQILWNQPALEEIIVLLEQPVSTHVDQSELPMLEFKNTIEFKQVSFRYLNDEPEVLDGLNLSILKGSRLGEFILMEAPALLRLGALVAGN